MIPVVCALPDRPASLVRAALPELPPMAVQQGIYGVVRVRVELDPTGAIRDAVIVSTPSRVLVPESLRAARASEFAPARRHCANAASSYEFRVLYAPDGPRASPLAAPSPSPRPKPDLALPWRLSLSMTGGLLRYVDRSVTSSRSYVQVSDRLPFSHPAECRATLSALELDRLTAALRAAQPETWRFDYYSLAADATPAPSPAGPPASRPDVDVVAMVRDGGHEPFMADAPTVQIKLIAGGTSYEVVYESGAFPRLHETVPAKIAELTRALDAAAPPRCAPRISERPSNYVSTDAG